jgi:urease accessory protein UreF
MWTDPIVEEIHQIRAEHAAQFNYDVAAIGDDLRKQEQQIGKKFVSFSPRLLVDKEKSMKTTKARPNIAVSQAVLSEAA